MTREVLFVCVENAGRSQIAEAFFRKFGERKFNVVSAGTVLIGIVLLITAILLYSLVSVVREK